jgi:RNA polymerase sigma-70 factor (ECF subfamily)
MEGSLADALTLTNEPSLVVQARAGNQEAFAELVRRHGAQAYRIAFALLKNRSDAEDAVQGAFLVAFRSLATLKDPTAFRPWLNRIVVNRSRDLLRKRRRGREFIQLLGQSIVNDPLSGRQIERTVVLRQAIDSLPELHRLVILLYYSQGYSTGEIAVTIDRPPGTVRRILSEAYKMLRSALGEGEVCP